MSEQLLTVEQYAHRAQLKPETVRRQLREGRLKAIKKGRVWRVPESAVLENTPAKIDNPLSQALAAIRTRDARTRDAHVGAKVTRVLDAAREIELMRAEQDR